LAIKKGGFKPLNNPPFNIHFIDFQLVDLVRQAILNILQKWNEANSTWVPK